MLDVSDTEHVIDAGATVVRRAGRLSGRLVADGNEIDSEDRVIAAVALLVDESVVALNVDHFGRIDGFDVRTC